MTYEAIAALADLQALKAVSPHVSAGAVDTPLREAQELDFRTFAGQALYDKLQTEQGGTPSAPWDAALEQANRIICYYALARLMGQHPTLVTRFGVVQKTDESSERAVIEERSRVAQELRATGNAYAALFREWMEEGANIATFRAYLTDTKTTNQTGIRISEAGKNI